MNDIQSSVAGHVGRHQSSSIIRQGAAAAGVPVVCFMTRCSLRWAPLCCCPPSVCLHSSFCMDVSSWLMLWPHKWQRLLSNRQRLEENGRRLESTRRRSKDIGLRVEGI